MTQGFEVRPFCAAFRARMPAAIMTDGFDVFVHDVIAAIATAPWSIVNGSAPSIATFVGAEAVDGALDTWTCSCRSVSSLVEPAAIGSEAGNVSSTASSRSVCSLGVV